MKKICPLVKSFLISFFIDYLLTFFFVFMLLNTLERFAVIGWNIVLIANVCSGTIALIHSIYSVSRVKSSKITLLENWFFSNFSQLMLIYIILIVVFSSIKVEIIWSFAELQSIISLEWTMVSLSVAIFLVWNVVIVGYLRNKIPSKHLNNDAIHKRAYIREKRMVNADAKASFISSTYLLLNLVVLILATALTYIFEGGVTILKQNLAIASFYLCTNTIMSLFLDILKPFNHSKKEILEETKVTNKEIKLQNEIDERISHTLAMLTEIDHLTSIDRETKDRAKTELLENIIGPFQPKTMETEKTKTDDK